MAFGVALTILYQRAEGVIVSDRLFVVANAASGAGLPGFFVSVYDSRRRIARVEADRLSQRLTALNRVLRHDTRTSATVTRGNAELLADNLTHPVEQAHTIERRGPIRSNRASTPRRSNAPP